jgi:hypothetical protein
VASYYRGHSFIASTTMMTGDWGTGKDSERSGLGLGICLEGLRKPTRNIGRDSQYPG